MSLQLLEYDPRGTFSHLLRLPTSSSSTINQADDKEEQQEEELLYRKTLVGLSPSQKKQRKMWHKAMIHSINEVINTLETEEEIQNLPIIISDW